MTHHDTPLHFEHACIHTYIHSYFHSFIYIYIHIHVLKYTYVYIYIYLYILPYLGEPLVVSTLGVKRCHGEIFRGVGAKQWYFTVLAGSPPQKNPLPYLGESLVVFYPGGQKMPR